MSACFKKTEEVIAEELSISFNSSSLYTIEKRISDEGELFYLIPQKGRTYYEAIDSFIEDINLKKTLLLKEMEGKKISIKDKNPIPFPIEEFEHFFILIKKNKMDYYLKNCGEGGKNTAYLLQKDDYEFGCYIYPDEQVVFEWASFAFNKTMIRNISFVFNLFPEKGVLFFTSYRDDKIDKEGNIIY